MVDKKRRSDSDDSDAYKQRTFVDLRSVMIIIAALSGGSITDLGVNYFKSEVTPTIEARVQKTESAIRANEENLDEYISSHGRLEEEKDEHLKDKMDGIKEDIRELKGDVKEIERLIRNGR